MNRKQMQRMETRAALLDAARRAFAGDGYERTTVDEVARKAEVSKGAVYFHFPSKDRLFAELLASSIRCEQQCVDRATALPPDMVLDALLMLVAGDPETPAQLWLEFWAAASRQPFIAEELQTLEQSVVQAAERIVLRAQSGRLADGSAPPREVAALVLALRHSSHLSPTSSDPAGALQRALLARALGAGRQQVLRRSG